MIRPSPVQESIASTPIIPIFARRCAGKAQFILAEPDPTVPAFERRSVLVHAHAEPASAPTAKLAEPGNCSSRRRTCHGTGKCA